MQTAFFDFKNGYEKNILNTLGYKLQNGAIGIFPTDTVYGIGCDAFNEKAIHRLFEYKQRDYSKPINVLISNFDMLNYFVEDISEKEKILINKFWPGALTIIFKKNNNVSNLLTAGLNTIGIRMPNNQIVLDLINYSNIPLATTSANLSGKDSGIKINDFYDLFNNKVDFIIDNGITSIKKASTVVQIINDKPHILREGSISKEQIEDALNNK